MITEVGRDQHLEIRCEGHEVRGWGRASAGGPLRVLWEQKALLLREASLLLCSGLELLDEGHPHFGGQSALLTVHRLNLNNNLSQKHPHSNIHHSPAKLHNINHHIN